MSASEIVNAPPLPAEALKVPIVFYDDLEDTTPKPAPSSKATWSFLARMLTEPRFVEESPCTVEDGPDKCIGKECPHKSHATDKKPMAWSPVIIDGKRRDKNVKFNTALSLDLDHLAVDGARRVYGALGSYEHARHTTHNHRDDDICFRVVMPLSRFVHPNEFHRFRASAIAFLGVALLDRRGQLQPDPMCKDRSRIYFRPSHPRGAPHEAEWVRGKILDVDEVLDWGVANMRAPEAEVDPDADKALLPEVSDWDLDGEPIVEAINLAANNFPPYRRNEFAMALAGMLRRAGAGIDDARYIVYEICAQGGSDKPHARASTVDHTYCRSEDEAMTGFTRVVEILGNHMPVAEAEKVAKEFGEYLWDAHREAFLRGFEPRGPGGALMPPAAPIDFGELHRIVVGLASSRARSLERNCKIDAILLRRVLDGKPIARPGGYGDVETVREGAERGFGREQAIRRVVRMLAFGLPEDTPWDAVHEILRAPLSATEPEAGEDWLARAAKLYEDARVDRLEQQLARAKADAEQIAKIRESALAASAGSSSGGAGNDAAPPPSSPAVPPDGPNWCDLLKKRGDGSLAQTFHNASVILRNHEDFLGHLRWNEVSKTVEVTGGPIRQFSALGIEAIVAGIQDLLSSAHDLDVSDKGLGKRVMIVARKNPYDPIREYLNRLAWDRMPRLDTWLMTYCGAIETEFNSRFLRMVGPRWFIAVVARGLRPGCKVDNVLVLKGPGGLGKSSVFETIGGDWFCDTAINLGDKDSRMMAGQYWLCELAECVAFKRSGHEVLKNFFSSRVDKFRPPYGAAFEESLRRAVFVGTLNEDGFLTDETGNRKYWVVEVQYSAEAAEALRRDRDQLFAEAVVRFRVGEKWHVDYREIAITEDQAEIFMVDTPAKMKLDDWWYGLHKNQRPTELTTLQAWEQAFDAPASQARPNDLQAIGHALKKMGFMRKRDTKVTGGNRLWRYYPTEKMLSADRANRAGLFAIQGGKKDEPKKEEKKDEKDAEEK